MLSVSDTGHGMDKQTTENIFEPFFTTKEHDKGTGLGLATVYGIVKQHGGNIWVYSEPEQGTSLKVYLPISLESPDTKEHSFKAPLNLSGSEIVLLVEDNPQVRNMTLTILERNGYKVLAAKSGKEALALLDRHEEGPPDLLLTDVVMPEMNGKQLFEKVSGRYPQVKALYMSGYTDDAIVNRGVMDAGVHFIQKPFSVNVL